MTPVRIERIIPDAETRERISGIVFTEPVLCPRNRVEPYQYGVPWYAEA